jgi:hypothetical protein
MIARLLAAGACGAALALSACGGSDAPAKPSSAKPPDPNDKRAVAIACVRDQEGLDVQPIGDKAFRVGGPGGPRIDFFVSSGEAEGKQFDGEAQGAEQIGAALLYINKGTDDQLEKIEKCLDDQ